MNARATPWLDVPIVDLDPRGAAGVRGGASGEVVTAPARAQVITLSLNFAPLGARTDLRVELTDQGGARLWTGQTTREQGAASVNLTLPRQAYPEGAYVIRPLDTARKDAEVAAYRVMLRYAS